MALEKSTANPFDPAATIDQAYWRVSETNFNHVTRTGRIEIAVYWNKEARDSGAQPIRSIGYAITPMGTPAVKEVKDKDGNVTTPAHPGFPGFDALMSVPSVDGVKAFDVAKAAIYNLVKTLPEFSGSRDV